MIRGVAISGKAGSGKSTLARHVVTALNRRGLWGVCRVAFGDALKDEVRELYGVEKGDALGRVLLIGHGEAKRDADPLYWIRRLAHTIDDLQPSFVVIDDVRFPTELAWALGCGLVTVRLEAPADVRELRLAQAGHDPAIVTSRSRTEVSLDSCIDDFDVIVENDEGKDLWETAQGLAAYWPAAFA